MVETVAMDSVPPLRLRAYQLLCERRYTSGQYWPVETPDIAGELNLPTSTVRRALEELAAYRLVRRETQGAGKPDKWTATPLENA